MSDLPVTVSLVRYVRPGQEQAYEAWAREIVTLAAGFDSSLTVDVVPPVNHHPDTVAIFRFSAESRKLAWEASPECLAWLERGEPLTAGRPETHFLQRLEPWVALPVKLPPQLPSRWKISLLHWASLAPFSFLAFGWERTWWVLMLCVAGSVFVILPTLTRLFSWWLLTRPEGSTDERVH